jgi:hypothetical protein
MTKRSRFSGLLLGLFLFGAVSPGLAQAGRDTCDDPLIKLQREGWRIVQDGVLRRELEANEVETFVFGEAGFTWKLQDLQAQLQVLRKEFQARPTPELRRAIASHRKVIASTREMIERARVAEASGEAAVFKTGCTPTFAYVANASYKTDRQGVWADASADFNLPAGCAGSGEVYAYAFAKTTVSGAPTTATVTDGPRSGANVSAAADANRNGGAPCESYAFASVTSNNLDPSSYSKSATNSNCPQPQPAEPLTVTVSGAEGVIFPVGYCQEVTWTVWISGGTPGYLSKIYWNGDLVAEGTSYTRRICGNDPPSIEYVTMRADVIDSAGRTASDSHTIMLRSYY